MKVFLSILATIFFFAPKAMAQEEETAEITLEKNEDAFQLNFYEALKYKGLEDYNKAVAYFLECKKIDPHNATIDFELGKSYFLLKDFDQAEKHLTVANQKKPDNIWYQEALLKVYEVQNNNRLAIELAGKMIKQNSQYKEALARIYMRIGQFEDALRLLSDLDLEKGANEARDLLKTQIRSMLSNEKQVYGIEQDTLNNEQAEEVSNLKKILENINTLLAQGNHEALLKLAGEVLESYPTQPRLYLAQGTAQRKLKMFEEAEETLLMGLDFIIDDRDLENNFHKELLLLYQATGNKTAEEEIKRKLKN